MAEGPGEGMADAGTAKVFISYASQDVAIANSVVDALERGGIPCWIAPRDVVPGEFYADAIVRAIDLARATVLVLSQQSVASLHVMREVERASSKRRRVISFRTDRAPLPAALEYFLNTSHWLDASTTGVDASLSKLVDAVGRVGASPSAPGGPDARGGATPLPDSPSRARPAAQLRQRSTAVVAALLAFGLAVAGYFIADIKGVWRHGGGDPTAPLTAGAGSAGAAVPASSVAVLPFVDMSEKKDQEYFADGLAEELIDLLVKGTDLQVPARTSSFYFKGRSASVAEIGKALGVANLLEGSVRVAGSTMRVTVQLVRASDGYHVWSDSYDRKLKDVFRIQDEIAAATVAALKARLSVPAVAPGVRRTSSTDAYTQYLIGRQLLSAHTAAGYARSAAAFQRAIDLDPSFAAAYAGLSDASYLRDANGHAVSADKYARVQSLLGKAIELAPDLSDGYSERGMDRLDHDGDLPAAEADLSRALALDSKSSANQRRYGFLQRCRGNLPEAIRYGQQATQTDPLDGFAWLHLGEAFAADGRYAEAAAAFARMQDISPDSEKPLGARLNLLLYEARGKELIAAAGALSDPNQRLYFRALGSVLTSDEDESRRALAELIQRTLSGNEGFADVADFYAVRGDAGQTLAWLEKAAVHEKGAIACISTDPIYKNVRGNPRFQEFLKRHRLAPV